MKSISVHITEPIDSRADVHWDAEDPILSCKVEYLPLLVPAAPTPGENLRGECI